VLAVPLPVSGSPVVPVLPLVELVLVLPLVPVPALLVAVPVASVVLLPALVVGVAPELLLAEPLLAEPLLPVSPPPPGPQAELARNRHSAEVRDVMRGA